MLVQITSIICSHRPGRQRDPTERGTVRENSLGDFRLSAVLPILSALQREPLDCRDVAMLSVGPGVVLLATLKGVAWSCFQTPLSGVETFNSKRASSSA